MFSDERGEWLGDVGLVRAEPDRLVPHDHRVVVFARGQATGLVLPVGQRFGSTEMTHPMQFADCHFT